MMATETYGFQAGSTHPAGILSCCLYLRALSVSTALESALSVHPATVHASILNTYLVKGTRSSNVTSVMLPSNCK